MQDPVDKKSQHGCVRWALREHLTPPCYDFACGGLGDCHLKTNFEKAKYKASLVSFVPIEMKQKYVTC